MSIPQTIPQFADACRKLEGNSEAIYELFEDTISQELRDEIYNKYSDDDVSEPMRQAMNHIGREYAVLALVDY